MHRGTRVARGALLGVAIALAAPAAASADSLDAYNNGVLPDSVAINSLWVIVAGCFVMFMQAGFAFLEIGFSRGKNVGTIVAKILVNFSIAAIMYYAIGFAFAFGVGDIIGHDGFFLRDYGDPQTAFPVMGLSDATVESKWFFQFTFCAVSLAIVWGTTLERIKFGVYIIYAIVFAGFIYPIGSHWVFGGGWLQSNIGMQDFAGSTAVHMIGATGGLAVLLLLGPRRGKYARRRHATGDTRAQHAAVRPGGADPVAGLVRVQPGLDAQRAGRALPRDPDRHAARGRGRRHHGDHHRRVEDEVHRHRHGRQRRDRRAGGHHRAVRLRRAVGGADHRRHRGHHRPALDLRDRQADRRPRRRLVRARDSRHLGHARVRLLHLAAIGAVQRVRRPRRRARSTPARSRSWGIRRSASSSSSRSSSRSRS